MRLKIIYYESISCVMGADYETGINSDLMHYRRMYIDVENKTIWYSFRYKSL